MVLNTREGKEKYQDDGESEPGIIRNLIRIINKNKKSEDS